jgi:hypothetical protein
MLGGVGARRMMGLIRREVVCLGVVFLDGGRLVTPNRLALMGSVYRLGHMNCAGLICFEHGRLLMLCTGHGALQEAAGRLDF